MKIYFAGSIRGGRDKIDTYIAINELLEKYGTILDKHVSDPNLSSMGESIPLEEIYKRDIEWINEADILVAEVSTPSFGVGYEIAYAESLRKPVICLCDVKANLSAMIGGNSYIDLIKYTDTDDLLYKLESKLIFKQTD